MGLSRRWQYYDSIPHLYTCRYIWQLPFGFWWECRWVRNCFISWLPDPNVSQIKLWYGLFFLLLLLLFLFLFLSLFSSLQLLNVEQRTYKRDRREKRRKELQFDQVLLCVDVWLCHSSENCLCPLFSPSLPSLTDCFYWRKDVHELWCLIWVFLMNRKGEKRERTNEWTENRRINLHAMKPLIISLSIPLQ